jgi:hypothetical protein
MRVARSDVSLRVSSSCWRYSWGARPRTRARRRDAFPGRSPVTRGTQAHPRRAPGVDGTRAGTKRLRWGDMWNGRRWVTSGALPEDAGARSGAFPSWSVEARVTDPSRQRTSPSSPSRAPAGRTPAMGSVRSAFLACGRRVRRSVVGLGWLSRPCPPPLRGRAVCLPSAAWSAPAGLRASRSLRSGSA